MIKDDRCLLTYYSFVVFCSSFLCLSPTISAWNPPNQHHQLAKRSQWKSSDASFPATRALTSRKSLCAKSVSSSTDIPTIQGPFDARSFANTNCWGQQPLLLSQSFSPAIFAWEDIWYLAINNDDNESITSRLITHIPGALDSFCLHFGPFSETELNHFINHEQDVSEEKDANNVVSTLVINDVDRWIPSLSDWMDQEFGFLPRWRRDDAQVSLARVGGGIGPHVDNYDVFLIQVSGTRTWKIGLETLSVKEEFDHLVEASEVRVLDLDQEFVTIELGPGDCLYLPPRVVHWGSSTSNDCMTLSVGCRAPSASELLQRVTESIADTSLLATARYTDVEDMMKWSSATEHDRKDLSKNVKDKMKRLVLDLVEEQLEDDAIWDQLVGELVTEPNRPIDDYPTPLSEMDNEWKAELGIWGDANQALEAVWKDGMGVLRRAEGIAFAWSSGSTDNNNKAYTLFAQGRSFRLQDDSDSALLLLDMIANALPLSQKELAARNIELSEAMKDFLRDLLEEGLLYGDDDEEEEDGS